MMSNLIQSLLIVKRHEINPHKDETAWKRALAVTNHTRKAPSGNDKKSFKQSQYQGYESFFNRKGQDPISVRVCELILGFHKTLGFIAEKLHLRQILQYLSRECVPKFMKNSAWAQWIHLPWSHTVRVAYPCLWALIYMCSTQQKASSWAFIAGSE